MFLQSRHSHYILTLLASRYTHYWSELSGFCEHCWRLDHDFWPIVCNVYTTYTCTSGRLAHDAWWQRSWWW